LLAAFALGQSPARAGSEEECDRLYTGYLEKAKQALLDKKPDDAVAFLLKASAIAQSCAEAEKPGGQGDRKTPALPA